MEAISNNEEDDDPLSDFEVKVVLSKEIRD